MLSLNSWATQQTNINHKSKADSLVAAWKSIDPLQLGRTYNDFFNSYIQTDIDEAFQVISLLRFHSKSVGDTTLLLNTIVSTAEYCWRKGKYTEGIVSSLEATSLAENSGKYKYELARGYQNLGTINLFLYNKKETIHYYQKAFEIYKEIGEVQYLGSVLNNSGVAYMDAAEKENDISYLDSAQFYFAQVIDLGDKVRTSTVLNALGNSAYIYVLQEKWEAAHQMYRKWELLEADHVNSSARAMHYGNIGLMHLRQNNKTLARKYLYEGLKLALEIEAIYEMKEYYLTLAELEQMNHDYQAALKYTRLWANLKDSIYDTEKAAAISELEKRFDTEQKERQIANLEQENQIKALQAESDKQARIILIVVVVALLVIAGLFYIRAQIKAKSNQLLDAKNNELAQLNATKDRLFSIISHDLKSPLSSFHQITQSLTDNWEHLEKEQLKEFIESLRDSSANVRDMMDNLLKWALAQTNELQFTPKRVSSAIVISNVKNQLNSTAQIKRIKISEEIQSNAEILADQQFLEIIIRNLLSNALKFSALESEIEVLVEESQHHQTISIKDYGVGMDQQQVNQLLSGTIIAHDIQNSSEKGTGLGISLCQALMQKMGADLSVESAKQKGTTFKLKFAKAA
ncbi:MAG: ATP-binding protein [Reichenbachiella sp.]|uniref:sensor histidine kinase n=1 Tax=Reichenbachiella sp. TaxID=2184521 RepID=UPI002965F1C0|nr:ATP-binding protein [Reichenbachiella sp.]MDW3209059.1 ATP-binding protein [Reichenbachiella sp.]